MKTIATFLAGAALGAALLGLLRPATAAPAAEDLAREQVRALREIAKEIRDAGRECRR
jgi:hypothetical protein